jgi:S-DNA-T family DNA segregation ATPase FtsK/SpoIIIE
MARKENDNPLQVMIGQLRHMWRHRRGHETVGLIMDTFENLGYVTKDDRRPVIMAEKKTDYGWHLVIHLPPGISFGDIRRQKEYFENATNSWIDLLWKHGKLQMSIKTGSIPESAPYDFDPAAEQYKKLWLPVPLGYDQRGLEVFDLAESPHLLIGGVPGFGKSNFLLTLINSLLPRAMVAIIDYKRSDFKHLKNHCALIKNDEQAFVFMRALTQEMERRITIIENDDTIVKLQEYTGDDMGPFIVLVIDEAAEMQNERVVDMVDRVVRLGRSPGICVVAATQRPSKKIPLFKDDTRDMFLARLSFQMADETSSRIILGEQNPEAAYLPAIKGRALFKFGMGLKEIQTMHLPLTTAKQLLMGHSDGPCPAESRWRNAFDKTERSASVSDQPAAKRLLPR